MSSLEIWVVRRVERREVTGIYESSGKFFGRLLHPDSFGLTNQTEIPISDLSEADRPKLRVGAHFRHTWGIRDSAGGQRERISFVEFE